MWRRREFIWQPSRRSTATRAPAPEFAPFLETDSSGNAIGGYGPSYLMSTRSHSTYHALQSGVGKTSARLGLGFQASYTYGKSLDDTSAVLGGFLGAADPVLQTLPQDPRHPALDKGPSTFDVTHVFTLSMIQALPFDRAGVSAAREQESSPPAGKS